MQLRTILIILFLYGLAVAFCFYAVINFTQILPR